MARSLRYIGHYGCTGRLVKVGSNKTGVRSGYMRPYPKEFTEIECPSCEQTHYVRVAWREPLPRDEGRVEVTL